MTVQELMRSSLLKFGVAPDNARFSDDFYGAINDAQNDIATSRPWGFLRTTGDLTTTASASSVALPSNFLKPYDTSGALRITSPAGSLGNKIELMPLEQWYANYYEDGTDTDEPTYAYIMGDSLYLSPTPDAEYVIAMFYYKRPTVIANTDSDITVPTAYHELLKKMVWRRLQDAGYSSVQELQISDADIRRLIGQAARDDIQKYGGLNFNLSSSTYTRRTV